MRYLEKHRKSGIRYPDDEAGIASGIGPGRAFEIYTSSEDDRPREVCRTLAFTGQCKFGERCRHSHDPRALQEAVDEENFRKGKGKGKGKAATRKGKRVSRDPHCFIQVSLDKYTPWVRMLDTKRKDFPLGSQSSNYPSVTLTRVD